MQNISIEAAVDETRDTNNSHQPSQDPGQPLVNVKFYQAGSEIYSESRNQDPSEENTYFAKTFQDSGPPVQHDVSGIFVQFGSYDGENGVLRVWTDNLNANITKLEITYTAQENVKIKGCNVSITHPIENITKETEVIIANE